MESIYYRHWRNRYWAEGICAAQEPTPARLAAPANTTGDCHRLYAKFIAQWPYQCRGDVCDALSLADTYAVGFVINQVKKDNFVLFLTAHLMQLSTLAATESTARVAAMAQGENVARVKASTELNSDEWWGLTVFGQMALDLLDQNPRIGVMII